MTLLLRITVCLALVSSSGLGTSAFAQQDPSVNQEMLYVPVTPCRAFDTRASGIIAANSSRNFVVAGTGAPSSQGGAAGGCGVPSTAAAVAVSLTAVNSAGPGGLSAYAFGTAMPRPTRSLSFASGQGSTATAIVAIGSQKITVTALTYATQLAGDITGYFIPQIQALITSSGSISSGTSRIISVSHAGTGFYYITIDRPARTCAPQAITYNYGHYASVGLSSSSTPNVLSVSTWDINSSGAAVLTDESFFFHVAC